MNVEMMTAPPPITDEIIPELSPAFVESVRAELQLVGESLLRHELEAAGGAPLYVALESHFPTTLGGTLDGYTHPCLDMLLRPAMGNTWRGRGPAIVVNDRALAGNFPEDFRLFFAQIAVHEMSHTAERSPIVGDNEPSPIAQKFLELQLGEKYRRPETRSSQNEIGHPPFFHHDHAYIRIVLHAVHRVNQLNSGFQLRPWNVYRSHCFGLSNLQVYAEALGDEPARLARVPLSFLADVFEPPRPFTDLYSADVDRWKAERLAEIESIQASRQPLNDPAAA